MMPRDYESAFDGHQDEILDAVAGGETLRSIAAEYERTPAALIAWLQKPERVKEYRVAQKAAAHAKVEQAGDILDEAYQEDGISNARASLARSRAEHRRWLASKMNREEFGDDQAGVSVNLDFGSLHLSALMEKGLAPKPEPQRLKAVEEVGNHD